MVRLRFVPVLLLLGVVTIFAPHGYVMSQSNTTFTSFMTSTNTPLSTIYLTGAIPSVLDDDMKRTCYHFGYLLHVDASVKEVDATMSTSSPVNYYLMSKDQYNQFDAGSFPCEASYPSLELQYSSKSYALKWVPPVPGDYYIVLENISVSDVTYNMQLELVRI